MPELLDIVGQNKAIARLQRCLGGSRMPHAFLFVGPEGVGRRTTATAFAKVLLCENPSHAPNNGQLEELDTTAPLADSCGQCQSCRMIESGSHPDFQLVYKELAQFHDDPNVRNRVMQELSIAVIQSFLIAAAGRASSLGRGKVFVVRQAELMSIAAQNALLKTLEEPPPGVRIILTCRQSEQMLPTTRSRCSIVRFGLLPRDFVSSKLIEAGIETDEAEFWAAFTEGSIGRALRFAEGEMFTVKKDLIEQISQLGPGGDATLGEQLTKITDRLATDAVAAAKKADGSNLSKQLATRQTTGTMLELLASAFRDAITLTSGTERPLTHADQPQAIVNLAEKFDPIQLAEIIEQLSQFERLLWRNVSSKIVWDNVVITCASAAPLRL